jgi:hypothetical protein
LEQAINHWLHQDHLRFVRKKRDTARKLVVATRFIFGYKLLCHPASYVPWGYPMEADLRRSPRVPFIAAAEIIDVDSEVRLAAQTGDLSQHGCYMDMVNPLPLGVAVRVRIEHGKETFAATAGVVYSVPHLGMGLVFRNIEAGTEVTLEKWLTDSASARV